MKICFRKLFFPLTLAALFSSFSASAQEEEPKKFNLYGDASFRVASGQFGGGLAVWGLWGLGKSKKFSLGLGLRQSTHMGSKLEYTTAPAKFTSKEENIDTMTLENSSVTSFNLALDFRYQIIKKLSVGFNIDAIGFSFGPEQKGVLTSYEDLFLPKAKPTSLNALLVGDNDIGTLNSELYFLFHASERLSIKAGLSYLFTEYTTDKKYIEDIDNDRYRNKSMGGMIGIQHQF
jgi:hypothetical protein